MHVNIGRQPTVNEGNIAALCLIHVKRDVVKCKSMSRFNGKAN